MNAKTIFVIDQQTLACLALKELIRNISPASRVKSFPSLASALKTEEPADLLIAGLSGTTEEAIGEFHAVNAAFETLDKVFMVDNLCPNLRRLSVLNGVQLLVRNAACMEIVDCLQVMLGMKSSMLDVISSGRNTFQSPIQLPSAAKPLTVKQVQVMELMLMGHTIREIASELGLSVDTVKSHTKDAFSRLNASSRSLALNHYIQAKRLAEHLSPEVMDRFMSDLLVVG